MHETAYSLGLLLAEEQKYDEALFYLTKAAEGMREYARVHYNRGLLLAYQQRDAQAENALQTALELEPENLDFVYALADFYLKRGQVDTAKPFAERLAAQEETREAGHQILRVIEDLQSHSGE